jgi:hypothetical protein
MSTFDLLTILLALVFIILNIRKMIKNKKILTSHIFQIIILSLYILVHGFNLLQFINGLTKVIILIIAISFLITMINSKEM